MALSARTRDLLTRAGLDHVPPHVIAGAALTALLAVALAVWRFWPAAPAPEVAFDGEDAPPAAEDMSAAEASSSVVPTVAVHVAGAVLRPGVYILKPGDRVADAIAEAGGALGSAAPDAVNLARIVSDGERIYIPTQEEAASGPLADPAGSAAGAWDASQTPGKIDINKATASELEELPGVGPATAEKIVKDREANGPFRAPEDLMRVPGIGPKKFEAMRDLVTTG